MKVLIFLTAIGLAGFTFAGCSGNLEQYKPMNQVKPVKKPIAGGV